jgi:hypothetical protein
MSNNSQPLSNTPITPHQKVGLNSLITSLILDADDTNSSLVVRTGSINSFYIDKFANVGINSTSPSAQLEVASANGECIRLRYGTSNTAYASIQTTNAGSLVLAANSGEIIANSSVDVAIHNGSTAGLKLGGSLVMVTAPQLNYCNVTPGNATASRVLALDASKNISGINNLSAANLTGLLQTANQPNITMVGQLVSLVIDGNLTVNGSFSLSGGGSIATSLGYISNATPGTATASNALVVNANKDITAINNIGVTSVAIGSSTITSVNAGYLTGITPGTATALKSLVVDANKDITGMRSLSLSGGNGLLSLTNALSSGYVEQSFASDAHTFSMGVRGSTNPTHPNMVYWHYNGAYRLLMDSSGNISIGTSTFGYTANIGGSINASSYYIGGTQFDPALLSLLSAPAGTATANKALIAGASSNISGLGAVGATSITATTITGTLSAGPQIGISSVGTLTSLDTIGAITSTFSNNSSTAAAFQTWTNDLATDITTTLSMNNTVARFGTTSDNQLQMISNNNVCMYLQQNGSVSIGSDVNTYKLGVAGSFNASTYYMAGIQFAPSLITGITTGVASANKALTADSSLGVSGIASISATSIIGTLSTPAQPYITSVGTLGSLTVTNGVTATTLTGTLSAGPQAGITSVGTLGSLTVTNGVTAATLTGILSTPAQPYITSVGTLGNLTVTNGVTATTLTGTLSAGPQTGITSVGTLGSLTVTNAVTAFTLTGTLSTPAQPYITSIGTLGSLSVTGGVTAATLTGILSAGPQTGITSVGTLGSLSVTNGITASTLTGTLFTSAQPNITSVGGSSGLTVSGLTVGGTIDSTSITTGSISTAGGVGIAKTLYVGTGIYGTLSTAAQPNITSIGPLSSLSTTSAISTTFTNNSLTIQGFQSWTNDLTTDVVAAISMNNTIAQFGTTSNHQLQLISNNNTCLYLQQNGSVSIGANVNTYKLSVSGSLDASTYYAAGVQFSPSYITGITPGTAAANKALVLDASSSISGLATLSATTLTGTLSAGPQTGITSVGTLSSLSVTNGITASTLTGTLSAGPQAGITSVGTLSSLNISGTQESTSASTGVIIAAGGIAAKNIYLNSTNSYQLRIVNTLSTGNATVKLNADARGYELGLRGSATDQPNSFFLYDNNAGAYRVLIDTDGNTAIGTFPESSYKLHIGGNTRVAGGLTVTGTLYMGGSVLKIYHGQHTMTGSVSQSKSMTVTHNLNIADTNKCCITMAVFDTSGNQDQFALKITDKQANSFGIKAWRIDAAMGWSFAFKIDWRMIIFGSGSYTTTSD